MEKLLENEVGNYQGTDKQSCQNQIDALRFQNLIGSQMDIFWFMMSFWFRMIIFVFSKCKTLSSHFKTYIFLWGVT